MLQFAGRLKSNRQIVDKEATEYHCSSGTSDTATHTTTLPILQDDVNTHAKNKEDTQATVIAFFTPLLSPHHQNHHRIQIPHQNHHRIQIPHQNHHRIQIPHQNHHRIQIRSLLPQPFRYLRSDSLQ